MPTVIFFDLLQSLTNDEAILCAFQHQIEDKAAKTESDKGEVDPLCLAFIREAYKEISMTDMNVLKPKAYSLGNNDLQTYLGF